MKSDHNVRRLWWEREDLAYRNGRLFFGNRDLLKFIQSVGTPVYVYNSERVKDNLTRLAVNLKNAGIKFKIFYALKANRYLPLVTYLKLLDRCGVDVCSPAELILARQVGFREEEITYTGTSVANEDLDCLQRHPGVQVNCDAISTIRRFGERCPGRTVGIRINPRLGAGYNETLRYAGDKPTKFGIYQERFQEAIDINEAIDLLAEDILLPPIHEGDYLALLNAGGYGAAGSSNHCMRGTFAEYMIVN